MLALTLSTPLVFNSLIRGNTYSKGLKDKPIRCCGIGKTSRRKSFGMTVSGRAKRSPIRGSAVMQVLVTGTVSQAKKFEMATRLEQKTWGLGTAQPLAA